MVDHLRLKAKWKNGFEICKYIKKDNWTRKWSKEHQVPFAYKSNQWVLF